MGWVTVALYLLAAWLCLLAARRSRAADPYSPSGRSEPRLWAAFGLVLLALGINKQLDLQSAFTEVMRVLARNQGWYAIRRQYQYAFIGAVGVFAMLAGATLVAVTRRLDHAVKVAALGMVLLLTFVTVRAMSFHHVDALIGRQVLYVRVNWMLEIGGIVIVVLGCVLRLRQPLDAGRDREPPGRRIPRRPARRSSSE